MKTTYKLKIKFRNKENFTFEYEYEKGLTQALTTILKGISENKIHCMAGLIINVDSIQCVMILINDCLVPFTINGDGEVLLIKDIKEGGQI